MRKYARHLYRLVLAGSAMLALSCAPSGAWAQQNNNNTQDQTQDQDRVQTQNEDQGILLTFDQFLDAHANLEAQLTANPSLVSNKDFLSDHPQLRDFLNDHPQIQQEIAANPDRFMERVARFERSRGDRTTDNAARPGNANPDLTRGQVASMDQFLDSHQSIEAQLEANPLLINNQKFLSEHPQLQAYLNAHPNVQTEFAENPQYFMLRTNRSEGTAADQSADKGVKQTNANAEDRNTNPDLTRGEVAGMDQFLDSHGDIAKQLRSNPSLINNAGYLSKHPELQAYLSGHPQVREEFTENPSLFMQRQGQYERTEYRNGEARYYNGDRDISQQDVATMDTYLDKHASEARDLQAYPARVNDSDYLAHHKDLESFFKKHPDVRGEFTENPSAFMGKESTFEADSEMDEFLDSHKKVAKDLDENPGRVKDDNYLNHHKELKSFLEKNPGVNDQFRNDPDAFMNREKRFDADRDFDVYLVKHRNVAKDLQKDPDRVKDDKYLNHHKDLKELLEKHPDLGEQAKMNPSSLMKERAEFHQEYRNEKKHEKTNVEQRANEHPH